jgi:putative membrane protein
MKFLYPMLSLLIVAPAVQAQVNFQAAVQGGASTKATLIAGPGGLGDADTTWMQRTARRAQFEFLASRMAAKKAQSPQVRTFAQTIVDDHVRSKADLHDIARANELLLPEQPDPAQQKELTHLKSLNGAAFDAAYLKLMQTANQQDLSAEAAEVRTVHDRALLKYVQQQQETDQKHAQAAAQLQGAQPASQKK